VITPSARWLPRVRASFVLRTQSAASGFTLVEVMVAATVLVLAITSSITTLQRGFQALDTARNTTHASQVMQSELERLRLKSWAQLQALQDSGDTKVAVAALRGTAGNLTCRRIITGPKTDMKEITLIFSWNGYDGRPHTLRYLTRYGKAGLYDYFYTSH